MSLAVTARQKVTVLTLADDVLNEKSLRAAFRVLNEPGSHAVHLDLRAVRLPTAEGLGLLVTLNKELRDRRGKLVLINVAPDPYGVFKVTGLVELLNVQPAFPHDHEPEQGSPYERSR
jgi:anti-anti-sigma factor